MQILSNNDTLPEKITSIITVGNFDGIHHGHQRLIEEIVQRAHTENKVSALITFDPHTRSVLNPDQPLELLTTFSEKAHLLRSFGIDALVRLRFDEEFRRQTPENFVKNILVNQLHTSTWLMGSGHTIGKDRSGSKNILQTILSKYHIMAFTADLLKQDDMIVSSTQIRKCITQGDIAEALEMLGHPYLISANRIQGLKIGSQLGFPTLNFDRPPSQKVLPPSGVYAAKLEFNGSIHTGALYFGDCPTFSDRAAHLEFHAFANSDVFPQTGDQAWIWLYKFIRLDRIFPTTAELVEQISNDIKTIQIFFSEENVNATH